MQTIIKSDNTNDGRNVRATTRFKINSTENLVPIYTP